MMNCNHVPYYSLADAESAMRKLIADAKRTKKGGKSWRRLNVFPCGNHFHVGRANKLETRKPEKGPSPGDIRRKARREKIRLEHSTGRRARHVFAQLGYLETIENAARRAKAAVDEMNDSLAQARKLADRYIFVK